ncbi:hypothetical protein PHMEG_00033179, partial [Phytophthora megakarya]
RGRGPGRTLRQSRRARDLQPEEQKPLEVIEKEARARRAVAREEKKAAESKDARTHAPVDSGADSNSDSSVEILGVSGPDVPEQASVGGAVKVESPAVDGTSEKSQLGHDVIEVDALEEKAIPGETPTIKLEGPLSTVKERSGWKVRLPNEEATSRMQNPSSAQETVDLTAVDNAGAPDNSVLLNLVKLYVDDQVRRWERVSLEFVMSPMIEYV